MRDHANIADVAAMLPEYMGFIFYEKSPRYVGDDFVMPVLSDKIKKVGVFVNAPADVVIQKIRKYNLQAVQLHSDEPAGYCKAIKEEGVELIKAFGIDDSFDASTLSAYCKQCDYFLFDTKSAGYGGSGQKFNWSILTTITIDKPIFISGGIGLYDLPAIEKLAETLPVYAIDINSKFETAPAMKDIHEIGKFIKMMNSEC